VTDSSAPIAIGRKQAERFGSLVHGEMLLGQRPATSLGHEPVNMDKESSHAIPLSGVLLLILVSLLWGGNMVSIKVSNQGIPPILAATLRSIVASALLWAYARLNGERVLLERADFPHGLAIGTLFGLEFLFLYWGPAFTDASRAIIFLYTTPLWVAVAAHFTLLNDRLTRTKVLGLFFAFLGLLTVFGSRPATLGHLYWVGDFMEVAAALLWAGTTIYVKKVVRNPSVTHFQTLFAQLFFAIPVLAAGSWAFERTQEITLTPVLVAALGYQTLVVAFFSYILWFWMIGRYPVSRLTAFTFLAPLFGVILSGALLNETLTTGLLAGLVLVAAGIYLVNRQPAPSPITQS
jgi:drug/metabolite transporter (DMT)-like permease